MTHVRGWRQNASTNADSDTRTQGYRVRELRPAHRNPDAGNAKEKGEDDQEGSRKDKASITTTLTTALTFPPSPLHGLFVRFFASEALPSQSTSYDLRDHERETFRIGQVPTVVTKALLIQVPEQMIRFYAYVRAMQLPLDQTPEVLHRVRMNAATGILDSMVH